MNLKALVFILSLAALISGCGGGGASSSQAAITVSEPMELTLLHINDHHSHLDAENSTFQLATVLISARRSMWSAAAFRA